MRKTKVDFSTKIREWDGFGVNYVEAAQTPDYNRESQDYGAFSVLSPHDRQNILKMTFGNDGLKPGMIKMFLDPFHQGKNKQNSADPEIIDMSNYDHETTTKWMRYFVREGLKMTRERGDDLTILTTLYGPPGWMTKQKFVRGRDFNPGYKYELAKYYVSWVKYLQDEESFPVKYISLHNEGEDWRRWPQDGSFPNWEPGHDYNMYWPPELVVEMMKIIREVLDKQEMTDVLVTPGETTNWYRFDQWGYAESIVSDPEAVKVLGLITSHGFYKSKIVGGGFGDWRSVGIDKIRAKNPKLHVCITSTSWSNMDVFFVNEIRNQIYSVKVNSIIPWALIQHAGKWVGGDPNPGTAFKVKDQGLYNIKPKYTIEPGYYFYKQVCRAGQPGMSVAHVVSNDSEIGLIAFAADVTNNSDAFVVLNMAEIDKELKIEVTGTKKKAFNAFRTAEGERYQGLGQYQVINGFINYNAPTGSVTTFYAE